MPNIYHKNIMKILGPNDTGKGILVEWDAGIINPNEPRNSECY
jgi:translation initiation factor RLI1